MFAPSQKNNIKETQSCIKCFSKMSELKGMFKLGQELMIQSSFTETVPKTRSEWKNVFHPESHGTP